MNYHFGIETNRVTEMKLYRIRYISREGNIRRFDLAADDELTTDEVEALAFQEDFGIGDAIDRIIEIFEI